MTQMEIITLDSGPLGRALWLLNNVWLITGFFLVCLLVPCLTLIGFLLYSSDLFVVWDLVSPIVGLVLLVGTGLAIVLAVSLAGLFLLPIGNQGVTLYNVNRTLRSKLRGSEKWGPVTLGSLFAAVLVLWSLVGVAITIVNGNQRDEPGITALTTATIGFVILVVGFWHVLPVLRRWFYFGRHRVNNQNDDFVLLLRSFKGDALHARSQPFKQVDSIEGMVTDMLERFTVVIAVSDPRDATQPVGAERIALQTIEWQPRVVDLMDRAASVVVVLDKSPGLSWELDRIFEKQVLSKTIFVVWGQERGWPTGAWKELVDRIGGVERAGTTDGLRNKIVLAATCSDDGIRLAVASAHTPLNCGLAVSTLLYRSIVGR